METSANPVLTCLECGVAISPEAKGLCPRCLLKLGFASQLSPGVIETGAEPPPFLGFDPADPTKRTAIQPFEFGGYRIVRLLGKGGMGAVYEAEELASGRRVALKVLGHSLDSADTRKRFIREGRLAASINHPNSVYVYGTEEIDGAPVITMELVPGGTLHERVKLGGPMPVAEAVDAIMQIIAGLEAAHGVGILHRDIKPSNCFIEPSGTVKVGDFGLSISTLSRGDSVLTIAGSILGTPEFSSPEQLRGEELNVRSDIYSVGMTLYYLLTGKTAFRGENVVQLLATVLDKAPQSPREIRQEIPEGLARIVLRCLSKQAAERPANYNELRRALYPFTSIAPTPATLGLRFVAGMIDTLLLVTLSSFLPMLLLGDSYGLFDPNENLTSYLLAVAAAITVNLGYYAVCEGKWGASPGKRLVGLRVGGLDRNAPGIPRALCRALIYLLPSLVSSVLVGYGSIKGGSAAATIAASFLFSLYPFFLAVTARRRNGFATITDLLTKTRVIQQSAYQPRESLVQVSEPEVATESLPKIGPYHVLAPLAVVDGDELLLGYDIRLLRRVWIRKSAPDAPPEAASRRNAARPGRLRWLQGQRDESNSWDAYEAVPGTPLTSLLSKPQPWKSVRHWLLDLAAELDSSSRDESMPQVLSLDRVWITAEGGAKLLDFPAPGSVPVSSIEPETFLNQVAIAALEGRTASEDEARTRATRLPITLRAREVLKDLRNTPFELLTVQLKALVQQVPHITRLRRLGLVAGCLAPVLVMGAFMIGGFKMMEKWERQYPEVTLLRNALTAHSVIPMMRDPAGQDSTVRLRAAEIFIAHRFGNFIRDPKSWNSQMATAAILPKMRAEAERIASAYPNPDPAEIERARVTLGGMIDAQGNLGISPMTGRSKMPPWEFFAAGVMFWIALFSVVAALFRGGLLMRGLGIAVVRKDGSDASRWRMLWRACVAWSWMPIAVILMGFLHDTGYKRLGMVISMLPIVCLATWSAATKGRMLQDRLAGTWLVPR